MEAPVAVSVSELELSQASLQANDEEEESNAA